MPSRRRLPTFALRAAFALSALTTATLAVLAVAGGSPGRERDYLAGICLTGLATVLANTAIRRRGLHDTDHENGSHR